MPSNESFPEDGKRIFCFKEKLQVPPYFKAGFCQITGYAYAIAVTNCTAGLHPALRALGIGRKGV